MCAQCVFMYLYSLRHTFLLARQRDCKRSAACCLHLLLRTVSSLIPCRVRRSWFLTRIAHCEVALVWLAFVCRRQPPTAVLSPRATRRAWGDWENGRKPNLFSVGQPAWFGGRILSVMAKLPSHAGGLCYRGVFGASTLLLLKTP